ncbi:hypothetical protein SAY87_021921 [Trapa incisa]|uniref:Non-specific serine/threonine protein kinase n=1 Tax=Trapa incisa TaxID=236973 RepID=A0AAN7PT00_9MYRT|nr:hypothetical protein SAY87_021921 [Trapa incisa]
MKQMWRSKPKGRLYTAAHCIFGAAIIVLIILSHAARARAQQNKTQHTTDPDEGNKNYGANYDHDSDKLHLRRKVSDPTSSVSGTIPEELWSLTHLTNLNLSKNVLTGPLSPSIGNLTQMQYLLGSVYFWLFAKRNVYTMGERKNLVGNNFTMINGNFRLRFIEPRGLGTWQVLVMSSLKEAMTLEIPRISHQKFQRNDPALYEIEKYYVFILKFRYQMDFISYKLIPC